MCQCSNRSKAIRQRYRKKKNKVTRQPAYGIQAESGYRSLNLDSVKWLKMGGVHYEVTPEPIVEFHDTTITQNEKATA